MRLFGLFLLTPVLLLAQGLSMKVFHGREVAAHVGEVLRLSHPLYREAPYYYAADDSGYEAYLAQSGQSEESLLCLVYDGEEAVGLAMGVPLAQSRAPYQEPFGAVSAEAIFYLGEFGLLPEYQSHRRELELYNLFEQQVVAMGRFQAIVLWELVSNSLEPSFGHAAGFLLSPNHAFTLSWVHLGDEEETEHLAEYWIKRL